METEGDFFGVVADHFIKRRGRGAVLSPADLACLAEWERAGVGVREAIRGIDEAFGRGGEIRSLRQCRWAVEAERRKGPAGDEGGRRGEETPLAEKLRSLAAELEEAARETPRGSFAEAIREAASAVRGLTAGDEPRGAHKIPEALAAIESDLLARLERALSADENASREASARAQLPPRRFAPEVEARTVNAIKNRELRRRFRLPPLAI